MRKFSVVLLAAFLVFAVAGQAMAAFENNHLVQVIYNDAGNEVGIDLGDIGAISFSGTNVQLAAAGTVPWGSLMGYSDLSLGYFGADLNTYENWFATTETGAPTVNVGGFSTFANGAVTVVQPYYDGIDVSGVATGSASAQYAYDKVLNDNSTTPGAYGGFNADHLVGESNLAALGTVGYVDMYLYSYDIVTLDKGPDPGTDYTGILRLYADGSTVLNPSAVPIPGAAILLGSGLLGLVGIRRRSA